MDTEENITWIDYQNEDGSISHYKCFSDGNITYPLGVERNGVFSPTKTSKPYTNYNFEISKKATK